MSVYKDKEVLESLGITWMNGDNIRCECPVHGGQGNNFVFYPDRGTWKCWSHNCEQDYGSDLTGLVMGSLSCSRENANKYIYNLTADSPSYRKNLAKPRVTTNKVIDPNVLYGADHSVEYFRNRGFLDSTVKHFTGFLCKNPKKKLYGRAVVPLFDDLGNLVGFTGRSIADGTPKWLHTPKNLRKSLILYNLNIARKHLKNNTIILVEAPLDVWRLHECGVYNAVALLGTTISNEQIALLKKHGVTKTIVLTDPDEAGMRSVLARGGLFNRLFEADFSVHTLRHLLYDDIGDTPIEYVNKNIKPKIMEIVNDK